MNPQPLPSTTAPTDDLQRYLGIRERMMAVLADCCASLADDEVISTAKRLHLWRNPAVTDQALVFNIAYEAAAFHHRRGGETAIDRALRNLPADAPALDRMILLGCQRHRWSVYEVMRIHGDSSADLRDTRDDAILPVWDQELAQTIAAGERLAVRLVRIDGLWLTSGAATAGIEQPFSDLVAEHLPAEGSTDLPADERAFRDDIVLKLMAALNPQTQNLPAVSTKTGRNEPCPCGSGKKHKRCCG